jgi:hypothetical protein
MNFFIQEKDKKRTKENVITVNDKLLTNHYHASYQEKEGEATLLVK